MPKLIFDNTSGSIELPENSPIQESCEEQGVPFACTEGVCGTCVIEIVKGEENLSRPTQEEHDFLGDDVGEERLACQCHIKSGDVTIRY